MSMPRRRRLADEEEGEAASPRARRAEKKRRTIPASPLGVEDDDRRGGAGDDDSESFTDNDLRSDSEKGDKKPRNAPTKGKLGDDEKKELFAQEFDALNSEIKSIAKDQPRRISRAVAESAKWIERERPRINDLQTLLRAVPSAESRIDGRWTRDREEDFQDGLRDDPYLRFLEEAEPPKSNVHFIPMWKKICRLRRICPIEIIHSTSNYLEYGAAEPIRLEDGSKVPSPFWNAGFCDRLTRLAIGGPWGDDMDLLAMFIRYAVACRLNDRRPFRLTSRRNRDSSFLKCLHKHLFENRDSEKPIPHVHQDVRHLFRTHNTDIPWYSKMLRGIEKIAYSSSTEPLRGVDGQGVIVYKVTTQDLHCVERAVSDCRDLGRPLFPPVRDAARITQYSRGHDYPKTPEDISQLIVAHYVNDKRQILKGRLGESGPVGEADPVGAGAGEGEMDFGGSYPGDEDFDRPPPPFPARDDRGDVAGSDVDMGFGLGDDDPASPISIQGQDEERRDSPFPPHIPSPSPSPSPLPPPPPARWLRPENTSREAGRPPGLAHVVDNRERRGRRIPGRR